MLMKKNRRRAVTYESDFMDELEGQPKSAEARGNAARVSLSLIALLGVGIGGGWAVYDRFLKEKPWAPEDAFVTPYKVECSQLDKFKARTDSEIDILLGRPVEFSSRLPSEALLQYDRNRVGLAAFACRDLAHNSRDDITGKVFDIHVANEPVEGQDGTFRIVVSLSEAE